MYMSSCKIPIDFQILVWNRIMKQETAMQFLPKLQQTDVVYDRKSKQFE